MRTCYDESKYVKGKQIFSMKQIKVGSLYFMADDRAVYVARVFRVESYNGKSYGVDYQIMDTAKYRLNNFEYRLWDFMMQRGKFEPIYTVHEAVEPAFTCKACKSHAVPMPISAVQIINGQRIGRSCNYYRCAHCGTLNRHVWVTGYPTRYEMLKYK